MTESTRVAAGPAPKSDLARRSSDTHRTTRAIGNRAMGRMLAGAAEADQAVSGARRGRLPFAGRLSREAGRDLASLPTAIVPGLSDCGVSRSGRIALRPGASIEVVRHEVSHALGADEATARRAEKDPSVMRGLRGPARDGWWRKSGSNYIRVYRGSEYIDVEYDPGKTDDIKYRDHIINGALLSLRGLVASWEEMAVKRRRIRLRLRKMLAKGFDGMVPIEQLILRAGRTERESLVDDYTMGIENELREVRLRKKGLKYNDTVARTIGTSTRPRLSSKGEVEMKDTGWPLMKVSVDQVNKKKKYRGGRKEGAVELVFGPGSVRDRALTARRGKVTRVFEQSALALWKKGAVGIGHLVLDFNLRLRKLSGEDEALKMYQLEVPKGMEEVLVSYGKGYWTKEKQLQKDGALVRGGRPEMTRDIQTNIELPVRKIGDLSDETMPLLWDTEQDSESKDKAMFLEARKRANAFVDATIRPVAWKLMGRSFKRSAIDLSNMNAVFTLLLFNLCKGQDGGKGATPVMEKTGVADLIRGVLDVRDKTALWHAMGYGKSKKDFHDRAVVKRLHRHAAKVREKGGKKNYDAKHENVRRLMGMLQPDFGGGRYRGIYGIDGRRSRIRRSGREDHHRDPLGAPELIDRDYGERTGTRAGKDLPLDFNYMRRSDFTEKEAKIVFEVRRFTNPLNQLQSRLVESGGEWSEEHDTPVYSRLEEAASTPEGKTIGKYTPTDFHWKRMKYLDELGPRRTKTESHLDIPFMRQMSAPVQRGGVPPVPGSGGAPIPVPVGLMEYSNPKDWPGFEKVLLARMPATLKGDEKRTRAFVRGWTQRVVNQEFGDPKVLTKPESKGAKQLYFKLLRTMQRELLSSRMSVRPGPSGQRRLLRF